MERERGGRPRYPGVLTPAEQRVLDALRDGGSNAEIAARLGITRETVKTHIASMLSKLDLSNRHELAGWQPEPPRRGVRGWRGLLVRPAAGLGAATGILALIVIFAVVIGASRDDTESIYVAPVETEFEVMSCSSGVAVTNPDANSELVADCEALLGLRDTIRGTATLDWTGSRAMSDWMGVTVSGTPQRVTSLNLADLGLNGVLSGLLGELTGLTTLDLSGNDLTGMLPSKLALLTNLTNVSIAGTDFEGCAPPVLGDVVLSDVATTGLDDCDPPPDMPRSGVIRSGTYQYVDEFTATTLVLDIPDGVSLVYRGFILGTRVWLYFEDDATGAGLLIALEEENTGGPTASLEWLELTDDRKDALDRMFNQIVDSVWFD